MSKRRLVLSLDEGDARAIVAALGTFELTTHAAAHVVSSLVGGKVPRLGEGKGDTSTRVRELRETLEGFIRGDG